MLFVSSLTEGPKYVPEQEEEDEVSDDTEGTSILYVILLVNDALYEYTYFMLLWSPRQILILKMRG